MRQTLWLLLALATMALGCSQAPLSEPPGTPADEMAAESSGAARETAGAAAPGVSLAPLKVATWNLEWLNRANGAGTAKRVDADYERLRKYADLLNADVIAVQEVDGEEALRRVFDDGTYDYHVASQNGVQLTGFAYRSTLSVTENPGLCRARRGGRAGGHRPHCLRERTSGSPPERASRVRLL